MQQHAPNKQTKCMEKLLCAAPAGEDADGTAAQQHQSQGSSLPSRGRRRHRLAHNSHRRRWLEQLAHQCAACFESLDLIGEAALEVATFWGARPQRRGRPWPRACDHAMCWPCAQEWFAKQASCPLCRAQVLHLRRGYCEHSRCDHERVPVAALLEPTRHDTQVAADALFAAGLAEAEEAEDEVAEAEEAAAAVAMVAEAVDRDVFLAAVQEELDSRQRVWLLACALSPTVSVCTAGGLPGVIAEARRRDACGRPVLPDAHGPRLRALCRVLQPRRRGCDGAAHDERLLQLLRDAGLREVVRYLCMAEEQRTDHAYWVEDSVRAALAEKGCLPARW